MTNPKGTDMTARLIDVDGLMFDDRFRVGGTLYIEQKTGRSFIDVAEELSAAKDKPTMTILAVVLTALYLQKNDVPVEQAEKTIANLELSQMMTVMSQIDLEIEEKNSTSPEVDLTEAPAKE